MSKSIIQVENLSKRYVLSHRGNPHEGLRHRIEDFARSPLRWLHSALNSASGAKNGNGSVHRPRDAQPAAKEEFWALKHVSFEIKQGEVVGIIGRNGAGKSTLLKILSRITEPTAGRITINGRVASLLEVGTGFHPELTGSENIFLNGAILGMSKIEIKKKFDEIVAFAEIEKFLDTPVKRYSSGMYVRLAFAVAAHLEPEILVVDEVLAVGDVEFQRKCLGKMENVARAKGRTVLFVSHNMSAILALCPRCLLLRGGSLCSDQSSQRAVQDYLAADGAPSEFNVSPKYGETPSMVAGRLSFSHPSNGHIVLSVDVQSSAARRAGIEVRLTDFMGAPVAFGSVGALDHGKRFTVPAGSSRLRMSIPTANLAAGRYSLSLDLTDPGIEYYHRLDRCLSFEIGVKNPALGCKQLSQEWGYGSVELPLREFTITTSAFAEQKPQS